MLFRPAAQLLLLGARDGLQLRGARAGVGALPREDLQAQAAETAHSSTGQ